MSNLSPAALALEADLRLLTKLPRQMSADLNDIKERVFGSKDGVPRTEEQSRWRYVDAIVKAFNASGATSIDDFAHHIGLLRRAVSDAQKDRDTFINERDEALRERDEKHKDLILARRRANDLELEVGQLRVENTDLKCAYRSLTAERDSLRDELKKAREYYDSWQDALNRVQELRAEVVEQENSYNLLALVVVDLLKGRGVE